MKPIQAARLMGQGGSPPPSSFPVVLSQTGTGQPNLVTSHAVNLPTLANGDLAIIEFSNILSTVTPPSGWTMFANGTHAGAFQGQWYYRVCDGSEGATATFTLGTARRSAAIVTRIQAGTFNASTPPEAQVATGSSANPNPPNLSPSWGAANTLWIADVCGRNSVATVTYPFANGNLLQRSEPGNTGAQYVDALTCWSPTNAGSMNPSTFMRVNADWVAATIAVRPL